MDAKQIAHCKRLTTQLVAKKKPFPSEDDKTTFINNFIGGNKEIQTTIKKYIKNNLNRFNNPLWSKGDNLFIEKLVVARDNFRIEAPPASKKRPAAPAQPVRKSRRAPSPVEEEEDEPAEDEPAAADEGNEEENPGEEEEEEEEPAPVPPKRLRGASLIDAAVPDANLEEEAREEPAPASTGVRRPNRAVSRARPVVEEERFDEVAEEQAAREEAVVGPVEAAPGQLAEILALLRDIQGRMEQQREENGAYKADVLTKMDEFKEEVKASLEAFSPRKEGVDAPPGVASPPRNQENIPIRQVRIKKEIPDSGTRAAAVRQ